MCQSILRTFGTSWVATVARSQGPLESTSRKNMRERVDGPKLLLGGTSYAHSVPRALGQGIGRPLPLLRRGFGATPSRFAAFLRRSNSHKLAVGRFPPRSGVGLLTLAKGYQSGRRGSRRVSRPTLSATHVRRNRGPMPHAARAQGECPRAVHTRSSRPPTPGPPPSCCDRNPGRRRRCTRRPRAPCAPSRRDRPRRRPWRSGDRRRFRGGRREAGTGR